MSQKLHKLLLTGIGVRPPTRQVVSSFCIGYGKSSAPASSGQKSIEEKRCFFSNYKRENGPLCDSSLNSDIDTSENPCGLLGPPFENPLLGVASDSWLSPKLIPSQTEAFRLPSHMPCQRPPIKNQRRHSYNQQARCFPGSNEIKSSRL